jgi:hypothetical protein
VNGTAPARIDLQAMELALDAEILATGYRVPPYADPARP